MVGPKALLSAAVLIALAACCTQSAGAGEPVRLLFTGDISLSRQVARELRYRGTDKLWQGFQPLFRNADWVVGNLEGSVGDREDCVSRDRTLCFDISPTSIALLQQVGFRALGVENNHSADTGPHGRELTMRTIQDYGMTPLRFADAPVFVRLRHVVAAFIPLTTVPGVDGIAVSIPSPALRQKLRLARRLADLVVVYIHWGSELIDWPQERQRRQARWLIAQGVDVIVGHHPHVVVPPECVDGRPVFYSLGNFLFDQKYPLTKQGLIADCRVTDRMLRCDGLHTRTGPNTSIPALVGGGPANIEALASCAPILPAPLQVDGYSLHPWPDLAAAGAGVTLELRKDGRYMGRTRKINLLSLDAGKIDPGTCTPLLFALERHPSSIDQEDAPRPYVYRIAPTGVVALWRGSALAWPLIDATLMCEGESCYLCALHRGDSFIMLNPLSQSYRTAVYAWNGFGFSGVGDRALDVRCRLIFDMP